MGRPRAEWSLRSMWWTADARAGPGFEPAICRVMNACCYPSSLPASGSVFSLPVVFTLTLVLLNKQQIHSSGEVLRDLFLCAGSLGSDTTEGRIRIYTTWFAADCTSTSRQATVPVHRCTGTSRLLWYRY
jgi:hypothetical protein